jgi:hypothetical protein
MTRRPAARRPPKLPPPAQPTPAIGPRREPTARRLLIQSRVSGRQRMGRSEILATARRLVRGEPDALLELEPFPALGLEEVLDAVADVWGPDPGSPDLSAAVSIDPDRTLARAARAFARIADVARRRGRLAFATTRPASVLPFYQELARLAAGGGGDVLSDDETGPTRIDGRSDRRLRWFDGVAVVTDGEALLGGPGFGAGAELLFQLPPPDLVVTDRAIAGTVIGAQVETVVCASLGAIALGVAVRREMPITLVPLDDARTPAAYEPLVQLAHEVFAGERS